MAPPTLLHLPPSPWSEKVRWALDYHGVEYTPKEYVPMFGAPMLRIHTRQWSGPVTVPVLFDGDTILTDSKDIVLYAERHGRNQPLIPADKESKIAEWDARCQASMNASRAILLHRMGFNKEVILEGLPPNTPRAVGVALLPMMRVVMGYLGRKYGRDPTEYARLEAEIRTLLDDIRASIGGGPYIYNRFSAADLVCAIAIQFIRPVGAPYMPAGPLTMEATTWGPLAEEYADLVQWRDEVYAAHRAPQHPKSDGD